MSIQDEESLSNLPTQDTQIPAQIKDFHILPILLKSKSITAYHYLYIRPDAPRIPSPATPRSLFCANIPMTSSRQHFRELFSKQLGDSLLVERVDFESDDRKDKRYVNKANGVAAEKKNPKGKKRKRSVNQDENENSEGEDEDLRFDDYFPSTWDRPFCKPGSSCIIVFVDRTSMLSALKNIKSSIKSKRQVFWPNPPPPDLASINANPDTKSSPFDQPPLTGPERYALHNRLTYPSPTILESAVERFFEDYDALQQRKKLKAQRLRTEPDVDGFITVTRGGKYGAIAARNEEVKERLEKQKERQQKKKEGWEGFYRFQNREKRKKEEGDLRRRFEEDVRRVGEMRGRKGKFRPED